MACVNGRKKDLQRGQERRAEQERERAQRIVIDRLSRLGSQYWSASDCLRTVHWRERMELRGISSREFLETWRMGDWLPDDRDPDGFVAARGRCRIVVVFREETPHLVTAKYVAPHLSL